MIYGKDIPRVCAYCEHATDIDELSVLCLKYGPVTANYCCIFYKYDPLRRNPPSKFTPKKAFTRADFDINS